MVRGGTQTLLAACVGALLVLATHSRLQAQARGAQPSAETLSSAAAAFDHGTAAFVGRRYAEAAELFETAYHLVPRAPALIQAMRAHSRAGNDARAGTIGLLIQAQYSGDNSANAAARTIVESVRQRLVRVDVVCEDCTVEVDGSLQETRSFFVLPDVSHRVVGHFRGQASVEELVQERAGQTRTLALSPPPAQETGAPEVIAPPTEIPLEEPTPSHGITPVVFIVVGGATVVAGALTLWSGIDTNAGVDAYEANPTQEALDAGQSKELRTNILIATTATLAVGTLVLAFFTDFGSDDEEPASLQVGLAPVAGGAAAMVNGTF